MMSAESCTTVIPGATFLYGLVRNERIFDESDAWLDLWCHTVYKDYGNSFSFLAPVIQYGKYGCALTLEQLGRRWGWARQDGLPLYNMEIAVVAK
ncbi:MAG: hypothetical protein J6B70_01165 [Oscillospiraceae bacterium]|nr:hypothetical protein [Oscillospiraceae bacterium]